MYFKDIVLDSNRKMQNVEDKILMLNLYEDCFELYFRQKRFTAILNNYPVCSTPLAYNHDDFLLLVHLVGIWCRWWNYFRVFISHILSSIP